MRVSFKPCLAAQAAAWLIVVASLPCCKDKEGPGDALASAAAASAKAGPPCADGTSDDPPKHEFRPAIAQLRDSEYARARDTLRNLSEKYPNSATARVWLGDAVLYDSSKNYVAAADAALVHYRAADALHQQGCRLREVMHYYLRMGMAYAYLRKDQHAPAAEQLNIAKQHWPTSAEVYYHLARASALKGDLDETLEHLSRTFELAQARERPLFLRVHRSLDDWFERAERQSEFEKLLKSRAQDYQALKARHAAAPPQAVAQ